MDRYPIDSEMTDVGLVGPELAHLSHIYLDSPRALVFRNPSSEWQAWVLLLPLASRLSLLANPIFGQLTRAWGYNLRFVGIDRDRNVFDFRSLLADDLLRQLIGLLGSSQEHQAETTDILFEGLTRDMLTVLDKRRSDWGKHLDTQHRMESGARDSLFQRETRHADFTRGLRQALRDEIIDVHFYGRVLRAVDMREQAIEQRLSSFLESSLDPVTMVKLTRAGVGQHLGCYNWLHLSPRHAANRAHVLRNLPAFATYFAESLVPLEALLGFEDEREVEQLFGEGPDDSEAQAMLDADVQPKPRLPMIDLARQASRQDTVHSRYWASFLRQAVDAGQDREVVSALANRFNVQDNVLRRLWRERPAGLEALPTWQLAQVLRRLAKIEARDWPLDENEWGGLIEASAV